MSYRSRVLALISVAAFSHAQAGDTAKVEAGPKMVTARMNHNVAELPDGGLVLAGGHGSGFVTLSSAEVWHPADSQFTQVTMQYGHDASFIARMADGKYLIGGGSSDLGIPAFDACEILDPVAVTFTGTGKLVRFRADSGSATLKDGRVLVAGAWWTHNDANVVGEIFDPTTGSFAATGPLGTARSHPFVLPTTDGKAVVVGGYGPTGGSLPASPELYDPASNTFSAITDSLFATETDWVLITAQNSIPMDTIRLADGRYVLLGVRGTPAQYGILLFDPATRSFEKLLPTPAIPGGDALFAPLVDAQRKCAYILAYTPPSSADFHLFRVDLTTGKLESQGVGALPEVPSMYGAGCTLLKDGRIFITGGTTGDNFNPVSSTVLITPSFPLPGPSLAAAMYAGLTITGTVGSQVRVDYASQPEPDQWTMLTNLTLSVSPYLFFDTSSPGVGKRFYRAVETP